MKRFKCGWVPIAGNRQPLNFPTSLIQKGCCTIERSWERTVKGHWILCQLPPTMNFFPLDKQPECFTSAWRFCISSRQLFYQLELPDCLTNLKPKGQRCHPSQTLVLKSQKPLEKFRHQGGEREGGRRLGSVHVPCDRHLQHSYCAEICSPNELIHFPLLRLFAPCA